MRKAFTMIEVVIVIVLIGIISTTLLPKMERNLKNELADNVLSDIRYAQHMAMSDFRQSNTDNAWQKTFWNVGFKTCSDGGIFTTINSDRNDPIGTITRTESVVDILTNKYLYADETIACKRGHKSGQLSDTSERIFLTDKYDVNNVSFTGGCANSDNIGFDHLGRPHVGFEGADVGEYAFVMKSACKIKFTLGTGQTLTVEISPETGFVEKI